MVKELAWLLEVGVTESSSMEGRVYALVLFRVELKCFSVMADGKKYVEGGRVGRLGLCRQGHSTTPLRFCL